MDVKDGNGYGPKFHERIPEPGFEEGIGEYQIRTATMADLDAIAEIEKSCFPQAEAASRKCLERRLGVYPEHFWLLLDSGKPVSMVNGMVTEQPDLTDEMYENASLHSKEGKWQMIFGVDTLPEYRGRGCAGRLLRYVIQQAAAQGRKGLVLTCKETLMPYYERFGFEKEGISQSLHGGAVWYQMRLRLKQQEEKG